MLWNELLELHETFSKRPEDVTTADIDSFDLKSGYANLPKYIIVKK